MPSRCACTCDSNSILGPTHSVFPPVYFKHLRKSKGLHSLDLKVAIYNLTKCTLPLHLKKPGTAKLQVKEKITCKLKGSEI